MKLITRTQLGWPPSAAPSQTGQIGVKVHYEGTPVPKVDHSKCAGRWTAIRNSHLANTKENYSDVAYNFAVCQHGYVLEGRGIGFRTGANGNQELNRKHYAVLVMIGSSGDTQPSEAAITALREVILYLREHGAGNEIKGHRDGYATDCPGDALYALVKSGKLEPIKEDDEDMPSAKEVAEAVWGYGIKNRFRGDRVIPAKYTMEWADSHYDELMKKLVDLAAKVDELSKKLS